MSNMVVDNKVLKFTKQLTKLRVVAGRNLVDAYSNKGELNDIHSLDNILIQGNDSITCMHQSKDSCVILIGRVIGRVGVGTDTSLTPLSQEDLKDFILNHSLAQCKKELEGRFIIIKFSNNNGLEICTDRFGKIDVYYQRLDDGVIFSTDLDLLPFSKEKSVEYDQVGIAHSLYIYGQRPAKKHTLYAAVKRLGVGHIAQWKSGEFEIEEAPAYIEKTDNRYEGSLEDYVKKYSKIYFDAIDKRASSKGNIVFLSSGWDSSSILGSLVKLRGKENVRAIIGRYKLSDREELDNPFEVKRAQEIADYFGVRLEVVDCDFSQRGPELVDQLQPFLRSHMFSSCIATLVWTTLMNHIAQTSDGEALFSGEISDGVHNLGFSQFTTIFHPVIEFREFSDKMLSFLFGPTFLNLVHDGSFKDDVIYKMLRDQIASGLLEDRANDVKGQNQQLLSSFFIRDNRFPFWSLDNCKLFTEQGRKKYDHEMKAAYINKPAQELTPETVYFWYINLYNSFHWQGSTVATLYYIADLFGMEMNLPFYDSRLQDFLSRMPESWGRGLEIRPTKFPLKETLKNSLDYPFHLQVGAHSYLYDVIPNFNDVANFIHASAFTPIVKEKFKNRAYRNLLSEEIFDLQYIDEVVDNFLAGKEIPEQHTNITFLIYFMLTGCYGI